MKKSHARGHEIYYDDNLKAWRYMDGTIYTEGTERNCIRCNRPPNKDDSDACTGHIPGMSSACCGHGVSDPIAIVADTPENARKAAEFHITPHTISMNPHIDFGSYLEPGWSKAEEDQYGKAVKEKGES